MKKFHIDVYDIWLHVGINYPKKKFFKTYFADKECTETLEMDTDHFDAKGFTWGLLSTKQHPRVIFINIDLDRAEGLLDLVDAMSHEIFHAVTGVAKFVGMPLEEATEEPYAYLMGSMFKYIYQTVFEAKNEQL